jgi:hypothetical protein
MVEKHFKKSHFTFFFFVYLNFHVFFYNTTINT